MTIRSAASGRRAVGGALVAVVLAAGPVTLPASSAAADDRPAASSGGPLLDGRGWIAVGSFANGTALDVRLDSSSSLPGTEIDWDQRFGLQDANRFRLDGLWRFSGRHHLRVLYTDYSQTDRAVIDREIQWGDDLLPVNATVTGTLGFEVIEVAYEYAVRRTPHSELAVSAGLHYTTLEASLTADVVAPAVGARRLGGPRSVEAPLPVVGVRGAWRLGEKVYLDAQAQYFALAIDDIKGSLYNYRAALVWQATDRIGLGLGYDAFGVDVDLRQDDFRGKVDWVYRGPQAFINVAF